MGDARLLSRKSLRRDQLLELHIPPLPTPPPHMMKLPGVAEWWESLQHWQQQNQQAMNRFVNNLQVNIPPVGE